MDLLFACNSWWTLDAGTTFARLKEENPELVQAAHRGASVVDPETGGLKVRGRGPSLVPGGRDEPLVSHNEKNGGISDLDQIKRVCRRYLRHSLYSTRWLFPRVAG